MADARRRWLVGPGYRLALFAGAAVAVAGAAAGSAWVVLAGALAVAASYWAGVAALRRADRAA